MKKKSHYITYENTAKKGEVASFPVQHRFDPFGVFYLHHDMLRIVKGF